MTKRSTTPENRADGIQEPEARTLFPEIARTPEPPYYAVIFTTVRTSADDGYAAMAQEMEKLAAQMPGYLGIESVRGADGFGITVSYWKDEHAIRNWKENARHTTARRLGKDKWYRRFELRISRVERAASFTATETGQTDHG